MPSRRSRRPGRPAAAERTALETRAQLLEAAAEAFAERGYRAATVDDILERASLSKGTFYWHFAGKEELFAALLDERIDTPARDLIEVTRSSPAEAATAPVVSEGLAAIFERQRELVLLLHEYWSEAVRDPRMRERYLERQRALRDALARALATRHARTGVPLTMPAESLATAFIALAQGLSLEALIDPDVVEDGLYGELLSLVYDGMAARGKR